MADSQTYLDALSGRLAADGCAVTIETLGTQKITVGYKWQLKALTKLHVFTVATAPEHVNTTTVTQFVEAAVDMAKARKGLWRGAQSGVLVLPILVSPRVDPAAVAMMARAYPLNMGGFAAMAHPAIVDVSTGAVHTFRGTRIWGFAYNGLIKKKVARYVPSAA